MKEPPGFNGRYTWTTSSILHVRCTVGEGGGREFPARRRGYAPEMAGVPGDAITTAAALACE